MLSGLDLKDPSPPPAVSKKTSPDESPCPSLSPSMMIWVSLRAGGPALEGELDDIRQRVVTARLFVVDRANVQVGGHRAARLELFEAADVRTARWPVRRIGPVDLRPVLAEAQDIS